MEKGELGQSDLVRLLMILTIPGDEKLGQVDLINSRLGDFLFWVRPKQYFSQREGIPLPSRYLSTSQYC